MNVPSRTPPPTTPPAPALREAAERIAAGDLEVRVPVPPGDGDAPVLARALNRALDVLARDRRRLREVAARAFRAQETERRRIARELQEGTAQELAGLLLQLRAARGSADARLRERILDTVREGISTATDELRSVARALRPPALDEVGLAAAVEGYAASLREGAGVPVAVLADDVRGVLSHEGEVALYRIVQEALANAVRHAAAHAVRVAILRVPHGVRVVVEDDGRGFDVRACEAAEPCLGLFGMRERALYAGGAVELASEPGRGTRVVVELPAATADGRHGDLPILPSPDAA